MSQHRAVMHAQADQGQQCNGGWTPKKINPKPDWTSRQTQAGTCKTGSGAGKRSGAKPRWRSNHAWTEHQAGKRKRAS